MNTLKLKLIGTFSCLGILLSQSTAFGRDLHIYGFADLVTSQVSTENQIVSTQNNGKNLNVDPETRLGLNLSADLSADFKFAGQLLAKGNDEGTYSLNADWIFMTYRHNDNFSFRFGRQINPAFLFSEQIDVGFTYLWVRLPYEVYGSLPVKSFNGASVIYNLPVSDYNFQVQLMGGAGDISIRSRSGSYYGASNSTRGIELSLNSDSSKIRIAYMGINAEARLINTASPPNVTVTSIDFGTFHAFMAGASLEWSKFLFFMEGARIVVENGSAIRSSSSAYCSLGYQVTSKLTPYITYAWLGSLNGDLNRFVPLDPTTPVKKDQYSAMVGINYKVIPTLAVKSEYMRTQQNYNDSTFSFGANIYTVAVDFIF